MTKKRQVLVPLDRSNHSLEILSQLKNLIPYDDTKLILFHAIHEPHGIGVGIPKHDPGFLMSDPSKVLNEGKIPHPIYATQAEGSIQADLQAEFIPIKHKMEAEGFETCLEIRVGKPAKEILAVIEDEGIDLIAMTTHAREGLKRLMYGSVAEDVLHHVNIPILMLHPATA